MSADNKVELINSPIVIAGGLLDKNKLRKPKNKIMVVRHIALPVSVSVFSMASSVGIPFCLHSLNLLNK